MISKRNLKGLTFNQIWLFVMCLYTSVHISLWRTYGHCDFALSNKFMKFTSVRIRISQTNIRIIKMVRMERERKM